MTGTTDGDASSFVTGRLVLGLLLGGICRSAVGQNIIQSCSSNGALRLVGAGSLTAREGTVEICLNSTWGTVCDNFFGTTVAQVVCRQLSYPASGAIQHRPTTFGQGRGPVHIGAARCNGSEQRIVDCTLTTENNCVHSEDAGVECSAPCTPEGRVRLTGGDRPDRGTVWVCINGTWSTVSDNYWNIPDARVVCRQLGYNNSKDAQAFASAYYGEGFGPILLDYVNCTGTEATFLDCSHTNHSKFDHNSDAGVDCIGHSQLLTTTVLSSTHHVIVTSLFFTSSSSILMSLTQSSAATPTQTILLSPVTSTNIILTSSSLISSAQSNQLSTIFISSTKLSKAMTASFSQSVATTIKRTSFNEFTQLLSSSLSQSQLTSQTHHYTHMPSSSTELSTAQSMLIMTSSPMLSSMTKSLSQTQSMMLVTYSSMPTVSLSQSTKSKVTSLSTISMSDSHQISQLGTSTVANFPPISLSTTGTSSQHLNSFFSTQENVQTASQSQHTSSYAMKSSFIAATSAPSYGLLSLSLPSSTPSGGGGGSLSLPVIASISVAAGFITLIVFVLFVIIIIIGAYLCRRRRSVHDLTLEETPIVTAEQCDADTCIHIDTHSQDGNSVNSLMVHGDVCPTTDLETEQLKLRARQMETEPASRQLGHQESSDGPDDQRQDLPTIVHTPETVSDSQQAPLTDTQGATGLQEASDETSVDEVMEMRGLHPLSSSDDDPLHFRSSVHDC